MTRIQRVTLPIAIFAFAGILVAAAGALAQTAQPDGTRGFLWKVESATGSAPLYLAGSVHALSKDVYPLSQTFERAFESAGTLVEEIDLAEAGSLSGGVAMLAKGLYADGRTFGGVVSKETFALVAARLKIMGVPVETISPMKPWMVAMMLMAADIQKAGLDPSLGLDEYFFEKASAAGKPVKGLETIDYQVDRFDKMPVALQEQLLRSTLDDLRTGQQELKDVIDAWRRGDAASLERLLLASFKDYPEAYASLLVERNRNWLGRIDTCLAQRSPCFVVVGAAHLVGPDGLITLLRRKGYRVEQQ
jgi:uncharacterized protein YbaP (TraB family)